jgi:drug/metabolite transporter (DMT)-like permease
VRRADDRSAPSGSYDPAVPAADHPRHATGVAAVIGASAAWGLGTALSKGVIDDDLAPSLLLALQLLTASAVLGAAAVATGALRAQLRAGGALRLAATGIIEPGVSAQLYTLGLSLTAASTATIIFSTEPAMVVVMAWVFLAERPSARLVALCGLTLVGVVLVVVPDGGGGADSMTGVALVAAGTLGAVVRGMLASRQLARAAPLPLAFVHHVAGLGVASIVILAQLVAEVDLETPSSPRVWATAAGSGLIQYALPFWLYLIGLRHLRVGVATQFLALIPVFGVGFSVLLLGETFAGWQLVGGAIVLVALVGVTRLEAREHEATLRVPPWGEPGP